MNTNTNRNTPKFEKQASFRWHAIPAFYSSSSACALYCMHTFTIAQCTCILKIQLELFSILACIMWYILPFKSIQIYSLSIAKYMNAIHVYCLVTARLKANNFFLVCKFCLYYISINVCNAWPLSRSLCTGQHHTLNCYSWIFLTNFTQHSCCHSTVYTCILHRNCTSYYHTVLACAFIKNNCKIQMLQHRWSGFL